MINKTANLGPERERSLPKSSYFSDLYFAEDQLYSLAKQISCIHQMRPQSVLEIGPGNGFVSSFLRRAGIPVTTADINPALEPDIVAPLSEVPSHLGGKTFDVVVCCEVLEHMPYADFASNMRTLRSMGKRLFMTLPNYKRHFGIGGLMRLPGRPPKAFDWRVAVGHSRPLPDQHFWEVDHTPECSLSAVTSEVRKHYSSVETFRFALFPRHQAFIGQ